MFHLLHVPQRGVGGSVGILETFLKYGSVRSRQWQEAVEHQATCESALMPWRVLLVHHQQSGVFPDRLGLMWWVGGARLPVERKPFCPPPCPTPGGVAAELSILIRTSFLGAASSLSQTWHSSNLCFRSYFLRVSQTLFYLEETGNPAFLPTWTSPQL